MNTVHHARDCSFCRFGGFGMMRSCDTTQTSDMEQPSYALRACDMISMSLRHGQYELITWLSRAPQRGRRELSAWTSTNAQRGRHETSAWISASSQYGQHERPAQDRMENPFKSACFYCFLLLRCMSVPASTQSIACTQAGAIHTPFNPKSAPRPNAQGAIRMASPHTSAVDDLALSIA